MKEKTEIQIGRIYREHGVHGLCKVHCFESDGKTLMIGKAYRLSAAAGDEREAKIESISPMGRYFLVKFSGFKTPEELLKWRQATISLPQAELPVSKGKDLFDYEWPGFTLLDGDGQKLGTIVEVSYTPLRQLVVQTPDDDEPKLVPLVPEWIAKLDRKAKTLTVNLPEGLLS
jgi:16S rRNA processing protein RimM